MAIMLCGHVAVSGGRVAASLFALDSGAGESSVGLIVGLYAAVSAVFAMHFGRWSDRFGPRAVVRGGLALILFGIALPAIWPALPALYCSAICCGTGITVISVAIQHAVGNLPVSTTGERIALFGWLTVGHSVSSVLGPFVAGSLIDLAGFRVAFASLALGSLIAIVLSARVPADHIDAGLAEDHKGRGGWRGLLGSPVLRRIYLLTGVNAVAWDAFTFLGPVLGHRAQLSATAIGIMMSCFASGTLAVRLATPWLGHRLGELRILTLSFSLIAIVYLWLPFSGWIGLLFVLAFALGAGVGCGQPNVLSLLHHHAPAGRVGEAIGLRSMFGNLSGVAVPWGFGLTVAALGTWPVCWAIALAAGYASRRARAGLPLQSETAPALTTVGESEPGRPV